MSTKANQNSRSNYEKRFGKEGQLEGDGDTTLLAASHSNLVFCWVPSEASLISNPQIATE